MTDAQWDSLMIPINMAFFFDSSPPGSVVALYPSPAGADRIAAAAGSLERHRRATIRRLRRWSPMSRRCWSIASATRAADRRRSISSLPIDECFKLVGLIRAHWQRPLRRHRSVAARSAQFFAELRRAVPTQSTEASHA